MDGRTTDWAKRIGQLASGVVYDTYNTVLVKVFGKEERLVWFTTGKNTVCKNICRPMHGTEFKVSETKGILPAHHDCECTWVTQKEARRR